MKESVTCLILKVYYLYASPKVEFGKDASQSVHVECLNALINIPRFSLVCN
jgi:hypothetical protein